MLAMRRMTQMLALRSMFCGHEHMLERFFSDIGGRKQQEDRLNEVVKGFPAVCTDWRKVVLLNILCDLNLDSYPKGLARVLCAATPLVRRPPQTCSNKPIASNTNRYPNPVMLILPCNCPSTHKETPKNSSNVPKPALSCV